jgi:predicted enzyme related to lactoylglutathione lyase
MGTRTAHAPGTFSWVDLTTTDTDSAKRFYGELLGWEFEDSPIPEDAGGGVYTMCKVQGSNAAAISGRREGDPSPPHWNSYVTVESADDFASKANDVGGNVAMEPFDVMSAGRMAVVADPTGGFLAGWEPRESIGAERVNEPGCLTWNELHTPDVDSALEFYTGLFGWSKEEMDTGGGPRYVVIRNGDRTNGGVMPAQDGEPPNWLPYFVVTDRDETAEKATASGGSEFVRLEMPQGRIAVLADPQGAPFGIWEGETDD